MVIIGLREFKKVRDIIYSKTGIYIPESKVYFLKKRIENRLKELELQSAEDYIKYLHFFDKTGREVQNLINLVTVNETYFFREFPQLQAFAEHCLPEVARKAPHKKIEILSAGCSTGEEPYTLSIILMEMLDSARNFEITAIDIDENALEKAKKGIYNERSVKDVPKIYLEKYFDVLKSGYAVKPVVKKNVKFKKVNLFDTRSLSMLGKDFDFIFCRNVLIYFSDDSRRKVVESFYNMMVPGGYIFLGHSESVSRITTAFRIKRAGDFIVYQKPLE